MRVNGQRLTVLRDGIFKLSHLQQEFRIGVVRIGIIGNQFDIFLKHVLGVRIVSLLAVGIAEDVEGRRVGGSDFGSLLEICNCLGKFLLCKMVVAESG